MSEPEPRPDSAADVERLVDALVAATTPSDRDRCLRALRERTSGVDLDADTLARMETRLRARPDVLSGEAAILFAEWFFAAGRDDACRSAIDGVLCAESPPVPAASVTDALHMRARLDARAGAWDRAVAAWEEALRLVPDDPPLEMAIRRCLGEAWEALGGHEHAALHLSEALKLAAQAGSVDAEIEVLCLLGRQSLDAGEMDHAARYFAHALERARHEGARAGEAMALIGYGTVCLELGETDDADRCLTEGACLAAEAGDQLLRVNALERLGDLQLQRGDVEGARASLEEAIFLARGSGVASALASLHHMMAMLHESTGKITLALSAYEKAVDARRKAGDQAGLGATYNNIGSLYHRLGDAASARRFFREALLAFNDCRQERREREVVLANLALVDREPAERPRLPGVEERTGIDRRRRPTRLGRTADTGDRS